jgi:hypothetical protein
MSIRVELTASACRLQKFLEITRFGAAFFSIYLLQLMAILNDASVHDAPDLMRASKVDKL